jgi:hypothetical protein
MPQVLTLYMTPTLYIYMERIAAGTRALRRRFGRQAANAERGEKPASA